MYDKCQFKQFEQIKQQMKVKLAECIYSRDCNVTIPNFTE